MITREDLDKMIDKRTEEYEHLLDHEADKNLDYRYEYALHKGYKAGAQSIAPMLLKALDGLYFECGNRCAHQNPCNAKEVITEIESMINKQGEK